MFKDELNAGSGDITVWINSPGGDCVAAAQIYNMLANYKGNVTVKIDGIAASAASVIAMAGNTVLMSPVSMMMIHNPATMAFGDHTEMEKAIEMLEGVKDSIINAYTLKTGMSRAKLSRLMDAETWMDAIKAVEHKINIAATKPAAAWIEEGGALSFGDTETFTMRVPETYGLYDGSGRQHVPVIGHPLTYYLSCGSNNGTFAIRTDYLATINNLGTPVVKTADKTMKVIYTLQET